MVAEDGLKAQKLLAQGVWDVAYDTPSFLVDCPVFLKFSSFCKLK